MSKNLFFLLFLCVSHFSFGQILTLNEASHNNEAVGTGGKLPIIDINSRLSIGVHQNKLAELLSVSIKTDLALTQQLKTLNFVLDNQKAILDLLSPEIAKLNSKSTAEQRKLYFSLMVQFGEQVKEYPELRQSVNNLYEYYFNHRAELKEFHPFPQTYVIKNISVVTKDLIADLKKSPELNRASLQVTASIGAKGDNLRRVHVANFDNIEEETYLEVPRWVTSFSEQNMEEFKKAGELSNSLNKQIAENFSGLKGVLKDKVTSYNCFKILLDSAQSLNIKGKAIFKVAEQAAASTFLSSMEGELIALNIALSPLAKMDDQNANTLQQFNSVVEASTTIAKKFPAIVADLKSKLPAVLKTEAHISQLVADLDKCTNLLNENITNIKTVAQFVTDILQPFKTMTAAAGDISKDAFSFSVDKIPPQGFINLKTTGKRDNGDELIIRLIIRSEDDIKQEKPGRIVEQYVVTMQQIKFYSVSNISVILASPLKRPAAVNLNQKFQFAPAGSLLLKFGSRRSQLWNDLNPGFGINISTPDFDLDGAPDVSYGAVITLFRDVVSAGLSFNTKTSTSFWFFGLSFPFATIGLPINKVQTN